VGPGLDPEYAEQYRTLYKKHWWWRAREEMLVGELRERLPQKRGLSILDVGCGDALFFERLSQFGDVEGVESDSGLVHPGGPNRARIIVAPFDARFQPRRKYDLILMLDVLEHLDAPEEALRHALSLLKPGGIVVITVPAFKMLWTQHDRLNNHRTRYTKDSFSFLAKLAGMQILALRYFFIWLSAAKLVTKMIEALLPSRPRIPRIPPPSINGLLYRISRIEEKLFRRLQLPIGSSLLVVGTRSLEKA
jgi:SAM-dependent methyltransferase